MAELIKLTEIEPKEIEQVRLPLEEAWTLPPKSYTSFEVFESEQNNVFSKDWICVGHTSLLAEPGDYRCVEIGNLPLVITHDGAGEFHALSRICLHRSMPIAEGSGNAKTLTCPYHKWSYGLDGSLRGGPHMEGAEGWRESLSCLPEFRLEQWHGFLFVTADADAQPLGEYLAGLDSTMSDYGFEDLSVVYTSEWTGDWNWKLLVENFMETYHHIGPHSESAEPHYPAGDTYFDDFAGEPFSVVRLPRRGEPELGLPQFPTVPEARQHELVVVGVFPTFMFYTAGNMVAWYEVMPVRHDRTDLRIHVMVHKDTAAALPAEAVESLGEVTLSIHREDLAAVEGPWASLNSGLAQQGRLSLLERAIWHYNQLWCNRLGF